MKSLFYQILIIALISFTGCKKILVKPLPTLLKFGTVYEDVFTKPVQGVSITIAVCKGSRTIRSCDPKGVLFTSTSGSFEYPESVNELVFAKPGYKTCYVDLRETLPPNVSLFNDKLSVRMEK